MSVEGIVITGAVIAWLLSNVKNAMDIGEKIHGYIKARSNKKSRKPARARQHVTLRKIYDEARWKLRGAQETCDHCSFIYRCPRENCLTQYNFKKT